MTKQQEPTVYIVDDNDDVRETLCLLLRSMRLKAEAFAGSEEFLGAYDPDSPGCLLLDVRMPGMSGLALLTKLCTEQPDLPVIMLTGHGDVEMAVQALHVGAVDFIEKPYREELLLDAVQKALKHGAQARQVREERAKLMARFALLTPREREVLDKVVDSLANKEIAADLNVSVRAVEAHRSRIMKKMHARGVAQLVQQVLSIKGMCG